MVFHLPLYIFDLLVHLCSPAKTLVTFLLLTAISFALFARILDYTATENEFDKAVQNYRGIGVIEVAPPLYTDIGTPRYLMGTWYNPDSTDGTWEDTRYAALAAEQMAAMADLPYVTATSTRYLTAGVSPEYKRIDTKRTFYDYSSRYVFEGTLLSLHNAFSSLSALPGDLSLFAAESAPELLRYAGLTSLTFTDIVPLTVDPLPAGSKNSFPLTFYMVKKEGLAERSPNGLLDFNTNTFYTWNQKIHGGKIHPDRFGEFYGGKLDKRNTHSTTFPLGFDTAERLVPGERHLTVIGQLFVLVPQAEDLAPTSHAWAGDAAAEYWCDILVPLEGLPENYLELPEFEGYRRLIAITNQDYYTFDVVYTDDMATIPRFNERKMGIVEGRALMPEDESMEVCVISRDLAKCYGLSIGDAFPLSLCDKLFEQHAALGAVAVTRGRFSTPVKDVNLEIVGLYRDYDATWYGEGGFSTLDYMPSARAFAWSIDITEVSSLPLVFNGEIEIYSQGSGIYQTTVYVSGYGNGKASGVDYLNVGLENGTYIAYYSGIATNSMGLRAAVVPGASFVFLYR